MQNNIQQVLQKNIRQRLRDLQESLKLTQEEMAKLGGRTRISYAEYIREHEPRMPSGDFIANLVLNTSVNANWLLTGQGTMFNIESDGIATEAQELLAVYGRLGKKEQALLVEVAKAFDHSDESA